MKPQTMTDERLAAIRFVLGREREHVQKNAKELLAEVDALRASLAAAEAKLADERKQLTAALEDERRHADALADKLSILALGRINRTEVTAHFARRNAEKEER